MAANEAEEVDEEVAPQELAVESKSESVLCSLRESLDSIADGKEVPLFRDIVDHVEAPPSLQAYIPS
jgi:hypothetical protein